MTEDVPLSVPRGLRQRVLAGEVTLGTFLSAGSLLTAEACALGGFDWLLADMEHGGGTEDALLGQLLAAQVHGVPVIVRSETAERIRVGRALDLGAAGVMMPRLDTEADVTSAMTHLRFPPLGDRGVASYNRSRRFGLEAPTIQAANESVLGVVQIESREALQAVTDIAAVDDVDVLFIGPGDLSHALGVPGQTQHPDFVDAANAVVSAARARGAAAGILASTAQDARRYIAQGFTFVGIASDITFLANAARTCVRDVRPHADSTPTSSAPA